MRASVHIRLFSRLQWKQRAPTHTNTHTTQPPLPLILLRVRVLIQCLSRAKHPLPTHTLAQMLPYTLALLYSLPPTSNLKRGPEIAQEAIRKNRARGGGGSSRGLQSKAIQGYTPESLSPPCHPSSSFALSASLCSDESVL